LNRCEKASITVVAPANSRLAKKGHPDNEAYHVSHEAIYKTLFSQARGALKKELLQHLRTKRIML